MMTNCPSCNTEMQALESLHLSHSNKTCPLAYRPWSPYELKIITDAIAAARTDALNDAAQVASRKPKRGEIFDHNTGVVIAAEIRALADAPQEPKVYTNLAEVKDKYFPNVTLDQLEGRADMPKPDAIDDAMGKIG